MSAAYRRSKRQSDPFFRRYCRLMALAVGLAAMFLIGSTALTSALGLRELKSGVEVGYFLIAACGIWQAVAFYLPHAMVKERARQRSRQRLQRFREWQRQNQ